MNCSGIALTNTAEVREVCLKRDLRWRLFVASSLGGIYGGKGLSELLMVCLGHDFALFMASVHRALPVYDILLFQNHHSIQHIERYLKHHLTTFPPEISFHHSSKTIDYCPSYHPLKLLSHFAAVTTNLPTLCGFHTIPFFR